MRHDPIDDFPHERRVSDGLHERVLASAASRRGRLRPDTDGGVMRSDEDAARTHERRGDVDHLDLTARDGDLQHEES
jgi:hypothetical protein